MEIQIPYSILFTFFFCLLLLILKPSRFKKSNKTLPPGPSRIPIIGNLHQLVGPLPHHTLRDLANKYGPLMHLQLGESSLVVVSSTEIAKEVMKTHDQNFANRPKFFAIRTIAYNNNGIGFAQYGHFWRQLKKIITVELLSVKRVQSFRTTREEEVSSLVKYIAEHEGSVVNLRKKLFPLSNSIVARATIGSKSQNVEAVISIMQRAMVLGSGFNIADLFPSLKILPVITGIKAECEKLHKEIDRILQDVIIEHEEKKKGNRDAGDVEDLVDVLLRIQKENDMEIHLSYDDIKATVFDTFVGATETTATTLQWAMSELIKSPEKMKEAQAEVRRAFESKGYVDESELNQLKYIDAVIKETLRVHPSLPFLVPRETRESCEINGYVIPAKTRVVINAWALARDPKHWNEPNKFNPQRFLNASTEYNFNGTQLEYIPFGSGRRICPGISFGYAVVGLALANLLYHFDWKLPNGMKPEDLDMDEAFSISVGRKNALCLVPTVYRP